jgi:hypothetical protein
VGFCLSFRPRRDGVELQETWVETGGGKPVKIILGRVNADFPVCMNFPQR